MTNRIALVTGASRGIGRATALALAEQGAHVAVTARSGGDLQSLVDHIQSLGGHARAVVADLASRCEATRVLRDVESVWGPVEILVNNAGIGSSANPKPLVEFDDEFWDLTFSVNVHTPYLLTKLTLPAMLAAKWGRVINIASINAKTPALHAAAYVASKHALAGLTKAAAMEVAPHGVTVNAVCPGGTRTQMSDKRLDYDALRLGSSFEQLDAEASPLGRRLEPEEVADMVAFLASDAAAAINGQCINVCGGRLLTS